MKAEYKILINSAIAGALVFFGAIVAELSEHGFREPEQLLLGFFIGLGTAIIMFLTKLQTYFGSDKKSEVKLLEFI